MSKESCLAHQRMLFEFISFCHNSYTILKFYFWDDPVTCYCENLFNLLVVCEIVTTVEHLGKIANEMLSFKNKYKQGNIFKP